jgi:hypothetical protein
MIFFSRLGCLFSEHDVTDDFFEQDYLAYPSIYFILFNTRLKCVHEQNKLASHLWLDPH